MDFDLRKLWNENQNICIFLLILVLLQCTGYLTKILNMFGLEGFSLDDSTLLNSSTGNISAAEEGKQESQQAVTGLGRTPSSCYPQQSLKPEDLLPTDEKKSNSRI